MKQTISPQKRTVQLKDWQKAVIESIDSYAGKVDAEVFGGMPDYTLNKALGVTMRLPRGSGHSWLANYIASEYPTLIVYGTMEQYEALTRSFPLHKDTETISIYEIFYAVFKPSVQRPTAEFQEIQKKFANKQVIVVDNSESVPPDMCDVIYNTARCSVVMLGH
jgi:hypothetical protein